MRRRLARNGMVDAAVGTHYSIKRYFSQNSRVFASFSSNDDIEFSGEGKRARSTKWLDRSRRQVERWIGREKQHARVNGRAERCGAYGEAKAHVRKCRPERVDDEGHVEQRGRDGAR